MAVGGGITLGVITLHRVFNPIGVNHVFIFNAQQAAIQSTLRIECSGGQKVSTVVRLQPGDLTFFEFPGAWLDPTVIVGDGPNSLRCSIAEPGRYGHALVVKLDDPLDAFWLRDAKWKLEQARTAVQEKF